MGTRGAYGFRINGQDKVTYNHWDSYPSCLGVSVADFVKRNKSKLKELAEGLVMVKENSKPKAKDIQYVKEFQDKTGIKLIDLNVSNQSVEDWYCLVRGAQGNFEAMEKGFKYLTDSADFLIDSLFCEWAYIINLDTGKLEIYKGFNDSPKDNSGRYAKLFNAEQHKRTKEYGGKCYYGVVLVKEIPFKNIKGTNKLMCELEEEIYEDENE